MTYYYGGLAVGITAFVVLMLRICCRAWSPKTRQHPTRAQIRVRERTRCMSRNGVTGARILIYATPRTAENISDLGLDGDSSEPRLPSYDVSQALAARDDPPPPTPTLESIASTSQQQTNQFGGQQSNTEISPPPYEEAIGDIDVGDTRPLLAADD